MDSNRSWLVLVTPGRRSYGVAGHVPPGHSGHGREADVLAGEILEIIGPGEKQHRAFNLCDGEKTQAEIAKELGLDPGNFSRTITRWVDEGIAIRAGKKGDIRPLHVYPLPEALIKKATKK
jgi:hypothetical protein